MNQIRFTQKGFNDLQKEYENLVKQRPAAVEDLKKARDMGDLSENGYYKAARAKLSSIDANLRQVSLTLKEAVVVNISSTDVAQIGSKVTLEDGKNKLVYEIVGDLESNPSENKISLLSPIGIAIAGKKVGDDVIVITPNGNVKYKILDISKI